jgi:hypothetical protein
MQLECNYLLENHWGSSNSEAKSEIFIIALANEKAIHLQEIFKKK